MGFIVKVKREEKVFIGEDIVIVVLPKKMCGGNEIPLLIEAPKNKYKIESEKLRNKRKEENESNKSS